ncbi:gamma-aminobutyric acid type B receptor subunit 1-like [Lingula anatina]|uniref:Gamma-aminobutyric acid type B receptor subunit 1-like n=1 Tax=Lingula anatina TaxID=7574 RepID=A0A1S3J848_LINAN|nr:gamma-aminobutyric acid type B receptor subunit 1-like [Lingula anatina]|eukprot:XP_013406570.1 gamma-aminobutyric acid type B receptor subunit 1-like [Lingula anatina]
MLPNYCFRCTPGLGMNKMYELLYNQPPKIMLITGCSGVSTFVAQAAKMWNLVVLAYGSSSPALSNRERFPTFFRTHPSATLHNPTRVKLFQKWGWTRIATIQQTEEVFTTTVKDLEERARKSGIEIAIRQDFLTNPAVAVRNLKKQDPRIIVGVFYENMARRVFCEVYKEKLYGKKYVWFLIGWYPDKWYLKPDPNVNCTAEQLREALEGHFTTEAMMLNQNKTVVSDAGITAQEFEDELKKRIGKAPSDTEGYPEAPLAYDAIWALAFAFNKTIPRLAAKGLKLEDFEYSKREIMEEIYNAMNSTNFLGVSGPVSFTSEGDRIAWVQIEQMVGGIYNKTGFYDYVADKLIWYNIEQWIDGQPPADRTLLEPTLRVLSVGTYIAISVFAALGILVGVGCLLFNYKHRHRRLIRMSHPDVNNITVIGCMICLFCVFLQGLDGQFIPPEVFPQMCQARLWLLSIGFLLGYGSMFSKISAVHRWTTRGKKEGELMKEWELHIVLIVILVLDLAALTVWQVLDPLYRELEDFPQEDPPDIHKDVKILPQLEHCESHHFMIWIGVVFGYKGLLLLFGLFLAYETRSIKMKQVNDSRFIGMSIYNVVVVSLITGPVTLVIRSQPDASFAFVSIAIILCSFLSMGLIFVPKIIEIIRNPRDGAENVSLTDATVVQEDEGRYNQLVTDNEDLKKAISEKEDHIRQLHKHLQDKASQYHQRSPPFAADDTPQNLLRRKTSRNFTAKMGSMTSDSSPTHYQSNGDSVFDSYSTFTTCTTAPTTIAMTHDNIKTGSATKTNLRQSLKVEDALTIGNDGNSDSAIVADLHVTPKIDRKDQKVNSLQENAIMEISL